MFKTGGTQPSFGIWIASQKAWMRDSAGNVAMFGKRQAESLIGSRTDMELKEVFICCADDLEDALLPLVQQRWAERNQMREALYGPEIAQAAL